MGRFQRESPTVVRFGGALSRLGLFPLAATCCMLTIVNLLTRSQWGAAFDIDRLVLMPLPAAEVWIHHTVTAPSGNPASDMAAIESIDIGRFGQPSYSYVIHPTGTILEGCGVHIGAHTYHRNSISFGVSFIGNFQTDQPTAAAIDACADLIRNILLPHLNQPTHNPATGWIGPYPTGGHRDVYPTACPGDHLYGAIPLIRQLVAEDDDMTDAQFQEHMAAQHAIQAATDQSNQKLQEVLNILNTSTTPDLHAIKEKLVP